MEQDLNKENIDFSWIFKPLLKENIPKEEILKPENPMKYLIICGSTISGVGKGSTLSAIAILLNSCGLRVTCVKVDPYLNIDAGTMSPYEHGEVFVLEDGGEVDLDLGNYERALRLTFTKDHNITSGKVFAAVINSERKGGYLGKTVQMVPHVTDMIKSMIEKAANEIVEKKSGKRSDVCLVEIGGTVGDIESGIFFEALRQFINEKGQENCAICLITYVPEIGGDPFEQKTKPTQFGVKELKSLGLTPNFIVCRSSHALDESVREKISFMANVNLTNIISCFNVDSIWDVPLVIASQNLHFLIMDHLKLPFRCYRLHKWLRLSEHIRNLKSATEVKIAIVGKYIATTDTYYSVMKSLQDSAFSANRKLSIVWLDSTILDDDEVKEDVDEKELKRLREEFWHKIEGCSGILVPGGFGKRGVQGKIEVCRYARENLIPYLGICLGMQIAVIEFCRNVLNIPNANSLEFDPNCIDVITTMDDTNYQTLGGTLRLGLKPTYIKDKNSLAFKIYGQNEIQERHRHRYEVNPKFVEEMEKNGFIFSGKDPDSERMTIAEIPGHPFFFSSQYHPEFKTNPLHPTPTFYSFVLAASKQYDKFRQFVKDRLPGISSLEREESEITSKDPKYNEMMKKVLRCEIKIKKLIRVGEFGVEEENVDTDVDNVVKIESCDIIKEVINKNLNKNNMNLCCKHCGNHIEVSDQKLVIKDNINIVENKEVKKEVEILEDKDLRSNKEDAIIVFDDINPQFEIVSNVGIKEEEVKVVQQDEMIINNDEIKPQFEIVPNVSIKEEVAKQDEKIINNDELVAQEEILPETKTIAKKEERIIQTSTLTNNENIIPNDSEINEKLYVNNSITGTPNPDTDKVSNEEEMVKENDKKEESSEIVNNNSSNEINKKENTESQVEDLNKDKEDEKTNKVEPKNENIKEDVKSEPKKEPKIEEVKPKPKNEEIKPEPKKEEIKIEPKKEIIKNQKVVKEIEPDWVSPFKTNYTSTPVTNKCVTKELDENSLISKDNYKSTNWITKEVEDDKGDALVNKDQYNTNAGANIIMKESSNIHNSFSHSKRQVEVIKTTQVTSTSTLSQSFTQNTQTKSSVNNYGGVTMKFNNDSKFDYFPEVKK